MRAPSVSWVVAWRRMWLVVALAATSCLQRPVGENEPVTKSVVFDEIAAPIPDAKLDLLFVIDNSASMADKEQLLTDAIPPLVEQLVNPPCVDGRGNRTPLPTPWDDCPSGASRLSAPYLDVHVGIITSSLEDAYSCARYDEVARSEQREDNGRLLGSRDRGGGSWPGFFAWTGDETEKERTAAIREQVSAVGSSGCGFEAPLEAMVRFLVDPHPWSSIEVVDCVGDAPFTRRCRRANVPEVDGVLGDPTILAQRAAFLRPDSAVAIVIVSDHDDCSVVADGPYASITQTKQRMARGSDACALNPDDACCYSCAERGPVSCGNGCAGEVELPEELDRPNLRCYESKRRFGRDFLYPVQRYVNALTRDELGLCQSDWDPNGCSESKRVKNPLFAAGDYGLQRDPSLVYLAGIVGVPWQLIQAQTDVEGNPLPANELHFQTSWQLWDPTTRQATWDTIVGDPTVRDPHMLESVASLVVGGRPGLATASRPLADEIHGHERTDLLGDDLQYACIFPVPDARDCDGPDFEDETKDCDCRGAGDVSYVDDNPVCYSYGHYSSVQVSGKAYPSLRLLEVLRAFDNSTSNASVASICARNVTGDPYRQDFGFNPALEHLVTGLYVDGGPRCLARQLDVAEIHGERRGLPQCTIVEASPARDDCGCTEAQGRTDVSDEIAAAARRQLRESGACLDDASCNAICLCTLLPAGATVDPNGDVALTDLASYERCQTDERANEPGWCYIDEDVTVISGNDALEGPKNDLVADCPAGRRQRLRFGYGNERGVRSGSTAFVACEGDSLQDRVPAQGATL